MKSFCKQNMYYYYYVLCDILSQGLEGMDIHLHEKKSCTPSLNSKLMYYQIKNTSKVLHLVVFLLKILN